MSLACIDCGSPYSDAGLDLVIPDQQWKKICPEDGILCANCICKRAERCGGTVVMAWIDQVCRVWEPRKEATDGQSRLSVADVQ